MKIEYRLKKEFPTRMYCPQYRNIKSFLGIKIKSKWLTIILDSQNGRFKVFRTGSPYEYDDSFYSYNLACNLIKEHQERLQETEKYEYIPA